MTLSSPNRFSINGMRKLSRILMYACVLILDIMISISPFTLNVWEKKTCLSWVVRHYINHFWILNQQQNSQLRHELIKPKEWKTQLRNGRLERLSSKMNTCYYESQKKKKKIIPFLVQALLFSTVLILSSSSFRKKKKLSN